MHPVVIEREADHDSVHAENALEITNDRNRPSLADRECFLAPFGGECSTGFSEHRAIEGKLRCWRAREALELNFAIGRKARAHEIVEGGANFLRVLPTDQAKRHLCHGLSWNDGFRPFAGVTADHSVDLSSRSRGNLLDQHAVLLACWHF